MSKDKVKIKVWTDGSYLPKYKVYGGAVLLFGTDLTGKSIDALEYLVYTIGGKDDYDSWNITGEVKAVVKAVEVLKEIEKTFDIVSLELIYDYEGIEKWITGKWGKKKPISKYYYSQAAPYLSLKKPKFTWVKGHSTSEENNYVDSLSYEKAHEVAKKLKLTAQ